MKKRNDTILILALLSLAAISAALVILFSKSGERVIIKQNNRAVYEGRLCYDKTLKLSGNTVVISGGYAEITDADCKNQICVRHKKIDKSGESIVCLPNKVTVEIK